MKRALASVVATAALALLLVAPAQAAFGLKELDVAFTDKNGTVVSQAGSHPFAFTTTLGVNTAIFPGGEVPEGEVKDLEVAQMAGLIGSQNAVPKCSTADFNTRVEGRPSCPDASAVGIVAVKAEFTVLPAGLDEYLHVPVYNLTPGPGEPARLGFVALNVPVVIDVSVSSEPPYNLVAHVLNIPQSILFYGSRFTIWGNPADPDHDSLRGDCVGEPLELTEEPVSLGTCEVDIEESAFLTLPRSCQGPLATTFTADSWQNIGVFTDPQSAFTHDGSIPPNPLGMTGCSELGFSPTVGAQPSTSQAESPSGLEVTIDVEDPQLTAPSGIAKSDIRKVVFALPQGVTANPSAAEGLGVCSRSQYEAASLTVRGCPEASKLGAVKVDTPLLREPLEGALYVAEQDNPSTPQEGAENPFDSLLAFYMTIENDVNGIFVKQAFEVEPDPVTGQLVSTTEDLPQLPFSHFSLRFREGPRSPLVTPPTCGTYTSKALLTPWSGSKTIEVPASFSISSGPGGGPCPPGGTPPFAPGFEAGSINNNAGSYSPFYMRLTRADGEQDMTRFDSILPPGVTGKLAGVTKCTEQALAAARAKTGRQELASPSCPGNSQIGHVLVGAGVGPALTYVPGKIYLAGPFGGAPLSVAVVTPAVAGPFDVGTVVTREALDLNPLTGEVQVDGAASEPIPHILKGIPLKLRDLRVYVDRQNFTLNPTSCDPSAVRASLFGSGANVFSPADDVPVALAARYQAANCSVLPFKPAFSVKLTGGTKRNRHPALKAVLTPRPGDANLRAASATLPAASIIDNAHIENPCTRVQFNANQCPPGSVLGTARAFTPLLDQPLEGPIYFRANGGERLLPDIVADLHGEGLRIIQVGFVDSINARIRTRFQSVPDAPTTKVVLSFFGGKRGLLVNSANLCSSPQRAKVKFTGQNGKLHEFTPLVKNSCKKKASKRRH
jgi:hypothetical protein